ncbi:hypothetical protein [Streptomyces sp. NPDC058653]|uniref:hypothetical protein n=1 Tax=Streptomyces sp. NPDC058653 TaxID=3346576 RepID=UPI0036535DE1
MSPPSPNRAGQPSPSTTGWATYRSGAATDPACPPRTPLSAAWNTPAAPADIHTERSRYLLGSPRGLGVRLVRDDSTGDHIGLGAWEIAARLNRWIDDIGGPDLSPGDRARRLIDALSQPDR